MKSIILSLLACLALAVSAQPTQQQHEWEWYLDEVISETFVGRNYFEYYYQPSAADMEQQRSKGEVNYFLNSPDGLNSKKVRDMIDRLMASYDDIKAVGEWHMTNTTYWKEFRYEKNKFRFSVKRKALDDGTYYVSVTETADYYKSLGKKDKQKENTSGRSASTKERSTRHDRKPVVVPDEKEDASVKNDFIEEDEEQNTPVVSKKEQRKLDAQRREDERRELRAKQRREQEQHQAEAKAQKEAEKLKKAEEKKQRQEEERLKKEEKQRAREQERERQRQEREAKRQERAAQRQQTAATPAKPQQTTPAASQYHYTDVALWLSEKYDFTQTATGENSCTMYSTAVKDVDMAKLAIKNALKGSDARMAVPWRLNSETGAIETGYTVDGHVLVFTIGKDDEGLPTITITEVSNEQFELFKQSL